MPLPAFPRPALALRACCLFACLWLSVAVAGAREYTIAPVPDWVVPVEPATVKAADATPAGGGVRYLLVDHQVRNGGDDKQYFTHYATLATSEQGVDEVATHELDFDPSYQALVLHTLAVIRDGRRVSRLADATVRVLQREKDLENRIYDGRLSAHVFLEDIRVGDTVEVAYSVHGSNPVFAGRRFGRFDLGWGSPVERQHARLLHPAARALEVRTRNGAPEPAIRVVGDEREYVWRRDGVGSLVVENDAPGWFDPYPHATWSEFADWNAVARWAAPLYAPATLGPALQAEVAKIRKDATTDEARLLAALRLVQGELRYLGFEIGAGSHAPRAPDAVFARRFGDCKDKVLLLVSLLHALDIRAQAALVNTDRTRGVADEQPHPAAFDHVIVRAELGGKPYWLDPTRSAQRSSLDTLHQPDFGRALVVDATTRGLVPMARVPALVARRRVDVAIDATAGVDKPARMTVTTTDLGEAAESTRARMASRRADELQKDYLNYYANYYSGLRVARPMTSQDDLARNRIVVTEHYEIPKFWPRVEAEKRLEATIWSPEMDSYLRAPSSTTRVAPVALAAGIDFVQRTVLTLHEGWDIDAATHAVEDPHFTFKRTIENNDDGKRLVFTDHYRTLADHVPSPAVPAFAAKLADARDQLGYTLYLHDQEPEAPFLERFNWMVAMIAVLLLAVFTWVARRLYKLDPKPRVEPVEPHLVGLRGWLVLPAIGLCLSPLLMIAAWIPELDVYAMPTWVSLTHPGGDSYDALWAPLLLFALAIDLAQVVATVLVAILFFGRRRSTPAAYVTLLAGTLVCQAILLVATSAVAGEVDPESAQDMGRSVVHLLVWGPYFLVSRRVRSTFTRRWKESAVQASGAGSTPPPRVDVAPHPAEPEPIAS